jgi:hypothetical protein
MEKEQFQQQMALGPLITNLQNKIKTNKTNL